MNYKYVAWSSLKKKETSHKWNVNVNSQKDVCILVFTQGAEAARAVLHHTLLRFLSHLHRLSSQAALWGAALHPGTPPAAAQTFAGHESTRIWPAWFKHIHISWVFLLQIFPVAAWTHSWAFIFDKARWTRDLDGKLDNVFFPMDPVSPAVIDWGEGGST